MGRRLASCRSCSAEKRPTSRRAPLRHDRAFLVDSLKSLVVALLLVATVAVCGYSLAHRPSKPAPAAWTAVSVSPQASVWSIAEAHPVPGLGTAATVDLILAKNALPSATVYPGQTILVPSAAIEDTQIASR